MKITSTINSPYFFYPGTTALHRPARRRTIVRTTRPTSVESDDELARKQEVVCGVILGLSLISSVVLSFWQLALP